MIIASIAMEELALGRILDAGGKQLEELLCAPDTDEADALAVIRSVTALLESIRQNQMILKDKLEAALAEECLCEPPCKPPCPPPCEPPCPPFCPPSCKPPKPPCPPPHPCRPCASPCQKPRPSIRLTSGALTWEGGSALPWAQASQGEGCPAWNPRNPALIRLDPERAYLVRYTVRLAGGGVHGASRWISLRTEPTGAFQGLPARRFSPQTLCRESAELTDSGVLLPRGEGGTWGGLTVCLSDGKPLAIEQAELWIEEFF